MATTSDLSRVTSIVLRFMRTPVLVLITVYAIAILGMVAMPGQDAEGNPMHMSFFHAFYFLTYTATTTGFGELPHTFTNAQRMWAIVCLYSSVVAWIYAIGSIIRVIQNPYFQEAVAGRSFSRGVKRISEPFFIICGFGDTGSLLTRGLNDSGYTAVVIDNDGERIKALALRDYRKTTPGLRADASVPKHLIDAGVKQPNCQAVVALTNDEDINVKIAVMARLLNPSVRVICLASTHRRGEYLEALGRVEIIDPFDAFARWLGTALYAPLLHTLKHWLIGAYSFTLDKPWRPPMGTWILCGYGRMGQSLRNVLLARGVRTMVIDPDMEGAEDIPEEDKVWGYANANTLRKAKVLEAAGVVAATDSDPDNLGILISARSLNPNVCTIVRQSHHENELAFRAADADLIMQPSLITARDILFALISPLIQTLLDHLREHHETVLDNVTHRIETTLGGQPPHLWTVKICDANAPAVTVLRKQRCTVTIGDIMRDPMHRERSLACVPLVLARRQANVVMPDPSQALRARDEVLFCGTRYAERQVGATLKNEYTLQYLVSGMQESRGYIMKWFARRITPRTTTLDG
ncbi:MAG: NAD-binding protein [Gammaproteobacteria bacterium]|nr:NAD-binding protein [Gammaproteobacteria bacterium]